MLLLAFALEGEERAGAVSLVGVGTGIVGVAVLLGLDAGGGTAALVGGLMVVLASLGYALGAWYLKRNLGHAQPLGVLAGTMTTTSIVTLPVALAGLPDPVPSLKAAGALTVLGTGSVWRVEPQVDEGGEIVGVSVGTLGPA